MEKQQLGKERDREREDRYRYRDGKRVESGEQPEKKTQRQTEGSNSDSVWRRKSERDTAIYRDTDGQKHIVRELGTKRDIYNYWQREKDRYSDREPERETGS